MIRAHSGPKDVESEIYRIRDVSETIVFVYYY
jgi:hypothetical protein